MISSDQSKFASLLTEAKRKKEAEYAAEAAYAAGGRTNELALATEAASDEAHSALKAMVQPRALSLTDVKAKVAALDLCYADGLAEFLDNEIADTRANATDERLLYSIVRDLITIDYGARAVEQIEECRTPVRDPLLAFVDQWEAEEAGCEAITDGHEFDRAWEIRTGPFAGTAMRGELPAATTPAGAARALRKALGVADLSSVERALMGSALRFLEAAR